MIVDAAKPDATQYTAQYELLRSQIIATMRNAAQGDTAGAPRGVGLALLLSEGMPGWLKTVEAVLRAARAPQAADSGDPVQHEESSQSSTGSVWSSSLQRHEVTTLLASLVLSTCPLVHQPSMEEDRSWQ
jgi:hypothetical protein